MTPLRVTAKLSGPICLPDGGLMLDALLMSLVALRDGLPPALTADECAPIDIPIARSECRRIYLCSTAQYTVERAELQYTNKRAPVEQYATIGSRKIKRVAITLGTNKSYRIPRPVAYLADDTLTWFCEGLGAEISGLLELCSHLGKKRSVGLGRVREWRVAKQEPWPGFPVLRNGVPLRTLPTDWPGITSVDHGYRTLLPPYWDKTREEPCAVPRHH